MEKIWLDALEFNNYGGWKSETQFVRSVGSGYLIASDIPGEPVKNATATFTAKEGGMYRIFVRTKNWKLPEAPGQFKIIVDGKDLGNICGKMPNTNWYWEIAGDANLEVGNHTVEVVDKTGWLARFAAIFITNDMDITPSPEIEVFTKLRSECKGVSTNIKNRKPFDFVVVGAGPGGVGAAISAARNGLKVALITGRPVVGGNASNEGTVNLDGASSRYFGMHETGVANDIKSTKEHFNTTAQNAIEILLSKEKNITLFCDELCIGANTKNNKILNVITINTQTLQKYKYSGKFFADCSGDGWLGYYAGAAYRVGREAKWEFGEEHAPILPDTFTMSGCICDHRPDMPKIRTFRAKDMGFPTPFETPSWAIHFTEKRIPKREPAGYSGAAWWIENSNDFDDIWNDEFARDEMVRVGIGYFGWLKNVYENKSEAANYKLIALALHNSKRESRRLIGDYVFNENDYEEGRSFPDAISYCGWSMDVHHPKGVYSGEEGPFLANKKVPITPIPYRCLYSKNVENLFMAGRCCSVSHLGLGSTRVEATIVTLGQAVGAAAGLCVKYGITPREIYTKKIGELQQTLIMQDMTIPNLKGCDPDDLAPLCNIEATSFEKEYKQPLTYGFLSKWVEIDNEHFCGPAWLDETSGSEYYKVLIKNSGKKQNVVARLYGGYLPPFELKEEKIITLEEGFEGWLSLPFRPTKAGSPFRISLTPETTILWREMKKSNYMLKHLYYNEKGTLVDSGLNALALDFHSKNTLITDGNPEKTVNGYTRWSNTDCNCWISKIGENFPQSITYTLPAPTDISSVHITTDTDLTYPRLAFYKPATKEDQVSFTAKDIDILIFDGDRWKKVATQKDNYLRKIIFNFKSVKAEKVKVQINSTTADTYVKVYEVRIYR